MSEIDRLAGRYPAVAFDVFDTLIHRDVSAPAEVFRWMEAHGRAPAGFAAARTCAEAEARAMAAPREVTLAGIYARPRLSGLDPSAELAAERELCTADAGMLAFYRRCRERGQRVYAVSDMYLPEEAVRGLLAGCGYPDWDGVFVSSEHGVQKRSGRLFRVFLQQTGLRAGQVLFFGDDRRADQIGAALVGIRCVRTPGAPPRPEYLPPPQTPAERDRTAWLANHAAGIGDAQERFGYTVLGPLAAGFAAWLQAQCAACPGGRLVFLARDMYLMQQAARLAGARDTDYLRVSRQSLVPALLMRPMTPQAVELLADALPRQTMSVDELLQFCGFETGASLPGYDGGQRFDLRARPLGQPMRRLLLAVSACSRTPAGGQVRESAAAVRAYLQRFDLGRPGTLLVDIGSGGTTQRVLQELCGAPLTGLYLACDNRLHKHLTPQAARVWLYGGAPAPLWFWMSQPLLEYLISEPCGATRGYRQTPQGPMPVQDRADPPRTLLAVQRGALRFAAEWKAGPHGDATPGPDAAIAPFIAMARRPSLWEAACFGDFTLEDGVRFRLAAPRPLGEYLRRPALLKRDLAESRWKIGFLRRLLRLPLPYDALYALLKRRG
ncbi:MAG TPA: hypothetical protein H9915_02180 [Candidatus Gemmiger faecigallinarum]|nr:hypothetical protein [Candidatus Gemmiger faecigallinarum]